MLFNSIEFLVFLPIVLLSYSVLKSYRTSLLLVASYFFYGWWNWSYLILILFSTVLDFVCASKIGSKTAPNKQRKLYLLLSLGSNLGLLAFFKYYNFFTANFNELFDILNVEYLIPYSSFLLPMGISFYTFQTMAYTIDVYKGRIKPERNIFDFALYVSFFPQLVAGPIERPDHLLGQLKSLHPLKVNNIKEGFYRVIFGMFKKVVIADRLALFVNQVYAKPEDYDGGILLLATLFFAFQIYCDFSGYSDIAIGTARMFGVELMENFRIPYLAKDIRDFWGRWHISLSTWFRDYLYIPLGGNRRFYLRNIVIVFLVSGFWHGANWTFIAWGALHGLYFVGQWLISKTLGLPENSFFKGVKISVTFVLVCFAWIFFRSNTIQEAFLIVSRLDQVSMSNLADLAYQLKNGIVNPVTFKDAFNLNYGEFYFQSTIGDMFLSLILIPFLMIVEYVKLYKNLMLSPALRAFMYFFLALAVLVFGVFYENQFIYFQF